MNDYKIVRIVCLIIIITIFTMVGIGIYGNESRENFCSQYNMSYEPISSDTHNTCVEKINCSINPVGGEVCDLVYHPMPEKR